MAPTRNAAVIFVQKPPPGRPIGASGQTTVYREDRSIDLETVPLNGGVLLKTNVLAIDLYIGARMLFEYMVDQPIKNYGIGVVIRSEDPAYKIGEHLYSAAYPFEEYAIFSKGSPLKVVGDGIPLTSYVGPLGMPGQTAWAGWKQFSKAQKGETVFVSTAAGVVGSVVCQLAQAEGLKVIASAGSDEKVKFLRDELKVDVAFNYKKQDIGEVLKEHGPIDIYWDAVGGKSLETVINHMNLWGRIIVCGHISQIGNPNPYGVTNLQLVLLKNLTMSGFIVNQLVAKYGDANFHEDMAKLLKEGKVKVIEQHTDRLQDAAQLLLDTVTGDALGKGIIVLSND